MANDEPAARTAGSADELRYMQQVYQNQYAIASNSVNMFVQEIQEFSSTQKTLENMTLLEGKDSLASIGGDCFLVSRVQDTKITLMAVGGGYLIEKDIDSAKQSIAALIQKRNESLNRLMKNRKELENALMEISYRLDNLR